jgi:hypothetical protein
VFSINQRTSHVPLRSHTSADASAAHYQRGPQPGGSRVTSLNGSDWQFRLFDKPENVPNCFQDGASGADGWSKVPCSVRAPAWAALPASRSSASAGAAGLNTSGCRSKCRATGRRRGMARRSTQTLSTPGPLNRRLCRPRIRRGATAGRLIWTSWSCPLIGSSIAGVDQTASLRSLVHACWESRWTPAQSCKCALLV